MILPQRSRPRLKAPSWPLTVLTVALAVAFTYLGRWQWQRGELRTQAWDAFARGADAAEPLGARQLHDVARYAHLRISGRFLPERQFLLDNRAHAGAPGYEVLTPFELTDGRVLLVDRGWVAFTGKRAVLPDISFAPAANVTLGGRIDELPSSGLAFGHAAPASDASWPKLTSFPRVAELAAAFGKPLEERMLLLDPGAADGYVRDWQPPGIPPARHFAYAIQWWAFACTLIVVWIVLAVRRARAAA
jgi:surfeit locus 1 family protein